MLKDRDTQNIQCTKCAFGHLCLPRTLTEEEKNKLDKIMSKVCVLEKGMHIFRQNDKMASLFAVYSGYCKEYVIDEDGNERIDNFYFPGDILGLPYMPQEQFFSSAVSLTKMQLCVIPLKGLLELMRTTPNLLKRFIHITSYKMQNDKHISISTNAKRRVADFLLTTLYRFEERKLMQGQIHLIMSQFDISNFLGMAYETVSRILHDFQNQNIIRILNKEIYVTDIHQLQSMGSSMENFGQK